MMPSELEYLDSACEMTVLPHPNAPGIAHVPAQRLGVDYTAWLASRMAHCLVGPCVRQAQITKLGACAARVRATA